MNKIVRFTRADSARGSSGTTLRGVQVFYRTAGTAMPLRGVHGSFTLDFAPFFLICVTIIAMGIVGLVPGCKSGEKIQQVVPSENAGTAPDNGEMEPWGPERRISIAPDDASDAVLDLAQIVNGGRYISWGEVNRGDGNLNGYTKNDDQGGFSDLGMLGTYNGEQVPDPDSGSYMKDPMDYNRGGTILSGAGNGDFEVWLESHQDDERVEGYRVLMRETETGSVVHYVTVPGPAYVLRVNKFVYDPGPPETQPENPLLFIPSGFCWTNHGAVGYVTKLVLDDSHNSIPEDTYWISVQPYAGNNFGTESSRIEIDIDDPESYADSIYLAALPPDLQIEDTGTSRIQIWISENEVELYHIPSCMVLIQQDEDSDIINWEDVEFHEYRGTNPSPPYFEEILQQGSAVDSYDITWDPLLGESADARTAKMVFKFYPEPSYGGVSVGTMGYAGYIDIPTNSGSTGSFTVQLLEYGAQQQHVTYYKYGDFDTGSDEYFDGVSSAYVEVDVS